MPRSSGQDLGPDDGGGAGVSSQQQQQVSPNESRAADQRACILVHTSTGGDCSIHPLYSRAVRTYVPRIVRVCCVSCPWHPGRLTKGLLNQCGKSYPGGRSEMGRAGKCSVRRATCAPARGRFVTHKNRSAPFSSTPLYINLQLTLIPRCLS